jgi:drug/metabolite transporter (DMT)-like permease
VRSGFVAGNISLLASMLCSAGAQLLLKRVIDEARRSAAGGAALLELLTRERVLRGGGALLLVGLGFLFWVLCLTRLDLTYAYPIACASVLFVTLFGAIFLQETVTARTWAGTMLVLVGVVLLGPSR